MENGQGPKTKTKKRSAAKVAEILERGTKILDLRKNGASLRAISKILVKEAEEKGLPTRGFSYEQVRKDFNEIVSLRVEEQQEVVEEIRMLASERLEEVLINYLPYVRLRIDKNSSDNDVRMKMKAGDTVIRAVKEHAELFGAKRPQKLELEGNLGLNWSEIAREAKQPVNLTDEGNE